MEEYRETEFRVSWEVEDGCVAYDEEWEEMNDDEKREYVEECIQEDFDQKILINENLLINVSAPLRMLSVVAIIAIKMLKIYNSFIDRLKKHIIYFITETKMKFFDIPDTFEKSVDEIRVFDINDLQDF